MEHLLKHLRTALGGSWSVLMPPDIFMIAGEASGDLLGGSILEALFMQRKDLDIVGIGGPLMRAHGLFPTSPMEELQVMGFIDVLSNLPRLKKIFQSTVETILHMSPRAVVTIDYPGFNLRLARTLRKKGYQGKLCHIVCPSVWAWGKKRIQTLANHYDLLLVLLSFEKPLFQSTSLKVEYIGHPLVQKIAYETFPEEGVIALFPGSRRHEIERNLPFYLRLIPKLQSLNPRLRFVLSLSQEKYRLLLQKQIGSSSVPLLSSDEMKKEKPMLAIAKCGTVVLELALRGIPTVVTYGMSSLDIALAQWLFRIHLPYYSLPNLILNRLLFPELIGPKLTDQNLFEAASTFLTSPEKVRWTHLECKTVRSLLQVQGNPSVLAASLILQLIGI